MITRTVLGQTVVSFLDTNDAGRDGAFEGCWKAQSGQTYSGNFVIQCKHTCRLGHTLRLDDLKDELVKCRVLVSKNLCDVYVLMTNAGISGRSEEAVRQAFLNAGVGHFVVFDATWIGDQILEHKNLRISVPRLYGLGDLSQIMDERAYRQAQALLASLQEDLSKIVLTGTYHRAADALQRHGFVLLLGAPGTGKTTIAATLSMASIDLWGSSVIKAETPAQVGDRWNPDEPAQFFWVDDAFGDLQYESSRAFGWNGVLPKIKAALKLGARIVMTSRDYIYNRARQDLKMSAFPLLEESHVTIDVKDLSVLEKQQILYNHIKLGNQPASFRTQVKPFLIEISHDQALVPEVVRRLGDSAFTEGLVLDRENLHDFVEKPEAFLLEVVTGLDPASRAALVLIFMRNGRLSSPIALDTDEHSALERLDSNVGSTVRALEALRDSFVRFAVIEGESYWIFKHPTIADALATYLTSTHELMGIYLSGTPLDKLLRQATCGYVGIKRALVVQPTFFDTVLRRLIDATDWANRDRINLFLTNRCSREFLQLWVSRCPEALDGIAEPGLYLSAVSETGLAMRLHQFALLPEDVRRRFVEAVVLYAVSGEDGYVVHNKPLRSMLTQDEETDLVNRLRTELVPNLGEVRRTWQSNIGYREDREQSVSELVEFFIALRGEFQGDWAVVAEIRRQEELLNDWIGEEEPTEDRIPPRKRLSESDTQWSERKGEARSIFEDVDQ